MHWTQLKKHTAFKHPIPVVALYSAQVAGVGHGAAAPAVHARLDALRAAAVLVALALAEGVPGSGGGSGEGEVYGQEEEGHGEEGGGVHGALVGRFWCFRGICGEISRFLVVERAKR